MQGWPSAGQFGAGQGSYGGQQVPPPDVARIAARDGSVPLGIGVVLLLIGGFWSGLVNIGLFTWLLQSGRPLREAMAMTFVSLVLIQFFKAYNYRSDRFSVLRQPFANRWLNLAVAWELLLLAAILYAPFLQEPFGTFAFTGPDLALTVALALTIVPVLEAVKWLERHGYLGKLT